MRIYIPDMVELFSWLDASRYRYTVLRSFLGLADGYPAAGAKQDIDILVDDSAIGIIRAKYGGYKRHQGVKCDFYHSISSHDGDYLGEPDFPPALAEKILERRRLWRGRFYVPSAFDHYTSLLYTLSYHKAELSGFPAEPSESLQNAANDSKYNAELDMLEAELGLHIPRNLSGFHDWLKKQGWSVGYGRLARNIYNNQMRGRDSRFLASLCTEWPQTLYLIKIGRAFSAYDKLDYLLGHIRSNYQLLEVKPLRTAARLRLNLRKNVPADIRRAHTVAVVLRAEETEPANAFADVMQKFLGWAVARGPECWPLTATQDEAQTLAELPFFFTEKEREGLFAKRISAKGRQEPIATTRSDSRSAF